MSLILLQDWADARVDLLPDSALHHAAHRVPPVNSGLIVKSGAGATVVRSPNSLNSLPLQTKVSAVLAILLAGFTLAAYLILRAVVLPTFEEVETAAAEKDLKRAEMAMRTDLDNLDSITADWAHWDEIYGYVRGENPSFASAVLRKPRAQGFSH